MSIAPHLETNGVNGNGLLMPGQKTVGGKPLAETVFWKGKAIADLTIQDRKQIIQCIIDQCAEDEAFHEAHPMSRVPTFEMPAKQVAAFSNTAENVAELVAGRLMYLKFREEGAFQ